MPPSSIRHLSSELSQVQFVVYHGHGQIQACPPMRIGTNSYLFWWVTFPVPSLNSLWFFLTHWSFSILLLCALHLPAGCISPLEGIDATWRKWWTLNSKFALNVEVKGCSLWSESPGKLSWKKDAMNMSGVAKSREWLFVVQKQGGVRALACVLSLRAWIFHQSQGASRLLCQLGSGTRLKRREGLKSISSQTSR